FGMARIALTARTSSQLIVDAPRFVALGAEHVQPTGGKRPLFEPRDLSANLSGGVLARLRLEAPNLLADAHVGISAELDVGAAAGHVGGNRDGTRDAGLGHDIGLLLMIAGVEDREHFRLGGAVVAAVEGGKRVGIGEVVLVPSLLA